MKHSLINFFFLSSVLIFSSCQNKLSEFELSGEFCANAEDTKTSLLTIENFLNAFIDSQSANLGTDLNSLMSEAIIADNKVYQTILLNYYCGNLAGDLSTRRAGDSDLTHQRRQEDFRACLKGDFTYTFTDSRYRAPDYTQVALAFGIHNIQQAIEETAGGVAENSSSNDSCNIWVIERQANGSSAPRYISCPENQNLNPVNDVNDQTSQVLSLLENIKNELATGAHLSQDNALNILELIAELRGKPVLALAELNCDKEQWFALINGLMNSSNLNEALARGERNDDNRNPQGQAELPRDINTINSVEVQSI
jgi:hypothetical protein